MALGSLNRVCMLSGACGKAIVFSETLQKFSPSCVVNELGAKKGSVMDRGSRCDGANCAS